MTRRRPWRLHELDNDAPYPPLSRQVAVLRYDGDPDVFAAVVHRWLIREGHEENVLPPDPQLYRWRPDPSGYYGVILDTAVRRGPGVWLGSLVTFARVAHGPLAGRFCNPCDAAPGERHHTWCAFGRLQQKGSAAA